MRRGAKMGAALSSRTDRPGRGPGKAPRGLEGLAERGLKCIFCKILSPFILLSNTKNENTNTPRGKDRKYRKIVVSISKRSDENCESEVVQSCDPLCDPMDWSPPGSSFHGILQARILEWVAISFSRRSSQPRDRTRVSHVAGRCFTI